MKTRIHSAIAVLLCMSTVALSGSVLGACTALVFNLPVSDSVVTGATSAALFFLGVLLYGIADYRCRGNQL